jgi:hypothetical protein
MPDQDIVERSLNRFWRRPYRLTKGGHSPGVVAESLVKSLAATLREEGGMPGFQQIAVARLEALAAPNGAAHLAEEARVVEQDLCQQQSVKLLVRAAKRDLVLVLAGRALPTDEGLVKEYLKEQLEHEFFSRALSPRLVGPGKTFSCVDEQRDFLALVWSRVEPQVQKLTVRLLADTSATRLRAPASLRPRRSTAELVEEPVLVRPSDAR